MGERGRAVGWLLRSPASRFSKASLLSIPALGPASLQSWEEGRLDEDETKVNLKVIGSVRSGNQNPNQFSDIRLLVSLDLA